METELKNNNIKIDFYVIIYLLEIKLLLFIFNRGFKDHNPVFFYIIYANSIYYFYFNIFIFRQIININKK